MTAYRTWKCMAVHSTRHRQQHRRQPPHLTVTQIRARDDGQQDDQQAPSPKEVA